MKPFQGLQRHGAKWCAPLWRAGRPALSCAAAACLALAAGCGGNDGADTSNRPFQLTLAGVDINGLPKGLSAQLTLTVAYEDGASANVTPQALWRSDDPAVARLDAQGRLTAVAEGQAVLSATYCDTRRCDTARRQVRVMPPVVQTLLLLPDLPYAGPGKQLQLTASGRLSDGSTADLTRLLSWSSAEPTVLQVQAGDGLAMGMAPGQSQVTATLGGLQASVTVTVSTGRWTPVAGPGVRLASGEAFAVGTRQVLAVGRVAPAGSGGGAGAQLQSHAFDLATRSWADKGSPSTAVNAGYTLTRFSNGDVLLAGGSYFDLDNREWSFRACSRYSASTGRWTTGLPAPAFRTDAAAAQLGDGRVLLVGGMDSRPAPTDLTEAFDPTSNAWSSLGRFAGVTGGQALALPDGRVLLLRGSTALVFDASHATWTPTAAPSDTRSGVATVLRDGRVLLTGAPGNNNSPDSPRAELYDPATGTWAAAAPMSTGRSGHAAVLLGDGTVMVAGGRQAGAARTVERFNPASGQWSAMSPLGTPRNGLSLVLLGDGTVVAVGGDASPASTTAELYW